MSLELYDANFEKSTISATIIPGIKTQFAKPVNLRQFYKDMHDVLDGMGFKDVIDVGGHIKKGEQPDQKHKDVFGNDIPGNRAGDMYEQKFMWSKKPDGSVEFEVGWLAQSGSPHSPYGKYTFKMDLVCRRMQDKEFIQGNNKTVLQAGTWEFRNSLNYENSYIKDYLDKLPLVKNSPGLKKICLHQFHNNLILADLKTGEKVAKEIKGVIHKHFR